MDIKLEIVPSNIEEKKTMAEQLGLSLLELQNNRTTACPYSQQESMANGRCRMHGGTNPDPHSNIKSR